jgi:adenylate kinase
MSARILLLGAPGAGKGTQAAILGKRLGVPHVSTGDMLRAAVAAGTPIGRKAKAVMESGRLVSDDVVIDITRERLSEPDCEKGFLLDGFPRTAAQARALDELLEELGTPLDCCLALTVDADEVVKRLLRRARIEGRSDDNEQTIRERMRVYAEQTAPLLEHYRAKGIAVEVEGTGSVDEIADRIEDRVQEVLA